MGCFSFYPVKHITTGDGGMFVSRNKELAENVSKARGFGVDRTFAQRKTPGIYDVPTLGLNYRMSDINAALGRVQLSRIEEILGLRKTNFSLLKSGLSDVAGLTVLDSSKPHIQNSHYCLSVVLRGPLARYRNKLIDRLKSTGIGTSIYYPQPIPRMTYYRDKYGYDQGAYPEATAISDHSVALPVGPHLAEDEAVLIGKTVREFIEEMAT